MYLFENGKRWASTKQLTCGLLYGWNWCELESDLTLSLFYYLTSYYEIYIVKK